MRKTILDKPPLFYVWSPFYRHFVSPIAWPLLRRLRSLLGFDEVPPKSLSRESHAGEGQQAILNRLDQIEAQNARQWEAIERLLLCILSAPSSSAPRQAEHTSVPTDNRVVTDTPNSRASSGIEASGQAASSSCKTTR